APTRRGARGDPAGDAGGARDVSLRRGTGGADAPGDAAPSVGRPVAGAGRPEPLPRTRAPGGRRARAAARAVGRGAVGRRGRAGGGGVAAPRAGRERL